MTEDVLLKVARRRRRIRQAGLGLLILAGLTAVAAGLGRLRGGASDFGAGFGIGAAVAAIVLAAAGAGLMRLGRTPEGARAGRVALTLAEDCQRRRAMAYVLIPVSLAFQLLGATSAARAVALGRPIPYDQLLFAVIFAVFVCLFALLLAGRGLDRLARPVIDDELARAHRADALALGFGVFTASTAFLLICGLFDRTLALEAAPTAAALPLAATAIRLFRLEQAAGVGED